MDDAVEWHTNYLEDAASLSLLADCDLIVMPYGYSGESASGAVRLALASGKPVATSGLPIFDDVAAVVHRVDTTSAADLATAIKRLLADDALRLSILDRAAEWLKTHDWGIISRRLFDMADGVFRRLRTSERGFLMHYTADSPLLFSQVGERQSKSIVFSGKPGFGLFGPYVRLPPGTYSVCYKLDPNSEYSGAVHFRVYAGKGSVILAMLDRDFNNSSMRETLIELSFTLSHSLSEVEFSLSCAAGFRARLLGVSIRRAPDR